MSHRNKNKIVYVCNRKKHFAFFVLNNNMQKSLDDKEKFAHNFFVNECKTKIHFKL
jgi:hypothetical protein